MQIYSISCFSLTARWSLRSFHWPFLNTSQIDIVPESAMGHKAKSLFSRHRFRSLISNQSTLFGEAYIEERSKWITFLLK